MVTTFSVQASGQEDQNYTNFPLSGHLELPNAHDRQSQDIYVKSETKSRQRNATVESDLVPRGQEALKPAFVPFWCRNYKR